MAILELSLLGGFRVRLASGSDIEIPRKKSQALLAYLALYPGQNFLRDKLASLLWGDLPDGQARHNLRQTLFALRAALPARLRIVLSEGETVGLLPGTVDVDVIAYERLAAEATPAALAEAASLYQGDFLDGFVVEEESFEEWLRTERERLREVALEVLARLLAHQMTSETPEPAIQTALRLLALDPLQETTHRTLMRLYTRQGRRAAALRQYQLCVDVLRRELATEPETATRQLCQQILPERATALEPPTPESRPRRRHDRRRRGFRVSLNPRLIGRAVEMDRLRRLLDEARRGHGATALIVGEAGVGKTRLVEELEALAIRRDIKVLTARAYETTQVLPFAPWVDALGREIVTLRATLPGFDAVWRAGARPTLPRAGDARARINVGGRVATVRSSHALRRLFVAT
jgi:DNA-binding SARP family transcriptional activator